MTVQTGILLEGLAFGESPRWHNGRLWLSDMYAHQVIAVDLYGRTEVIVEVPGRPSGLGWLPDGRLLVVSMIDGRLLRLDPGGLVEVANLHALASGLCNDMVVDSQGRAYIGNAGLDTDLEKHKVGPAEIILVTPDRDTRVVATDMGFPNGAVITPDGRTLIVAESFGSCLTAFEIQSNGSLTGRRVWALIAPAGPDGICLDAEGAIWVASPGTKEVLHIREGGKVDKRISLSRSAFACMLGGSDRRTLFILTADTFLPNEARASLSGRVEVVEVDVPGAGLP